MDIMQAIERIGSPVVVLKAMQSKIGHVLPEKMPPHDR